MCWKSRKSLTVSDIYIFTFLGFLSSMLLMRISDSTKTPDTCGSYYLLPMFPKCDLILKAIRCFNDTQTVIVSMSTPTGTAIHSFQLSFGTMEEIHLQEINKGKHEGLIVRSNSDISLYVHMDIGDSMVVYPIDALSRDYETPPLTSHSAVNDNSNNTSFHNGALFIFSLHNNTTITITTLNNSTEPLSTSALASSSTLSSSTFKLYAFEIHEYPIDTRRRYRLHSDNVFAVVVAQTMDYFPSIPGNLCQNITLLLLDFVPPYSAKGKYFVIALPEVVDFRLFVQGSENTSLVLTTDINATEIILNQSGSYISDRTRSSSSWISASHPVTIYIKITLCSNTSSSTATKLCADNGFFLPSLQHYFICLGIISNNGCLCTCPSVFQREIDPNNLHFFRNISHSLPATFYPLLVGDTFDVTLSIFNPSESKDVVDVIVTTNLSFIMFRYNLTNLSYLPGGNLLGTVYNLCIHDANTSHLIPCDETHSDNASYEKMADMRAEYFVSDISQCSCEFFQNLIVDKDSAIGVFPSGSIRSGTSERDAGDEFVWEEDEEDSTRPLIAVVVSLCVSIFAVIALISGYMLVEIMTRRKHVRNTKIRPFVS